MTFFIIQVLVVILDKIFQSLAVEGNVLLPKTFLDSTPLTVQPRLDPLHFYVFGKLKFISEVGDFHLTTPSNSRSRNGLESKTPSSSSQGLENLIGHYTSA
jgi:hypothetical protein